MRSWTREFLNDTGASVDKINVNSLKKLTPHEINLGQPLEHLGVDHQLDALLFISLESIGSVLESRVDRLVNEFVLEVGHHEPNELFVGPLPMGVVRQMLHDSLVFLALFDQFRDGDLRKAGDIHG